MIENYFFLQSKAAFDQYLTCKAEKDVSEDQLG